MTKLSPRKIFPTLIIYSLLCVISFSGCELASKATGAQSLSQSTIQANLLISPLISPVVFGSDLSKLAEAQTGRWELPVRLVFFGDIMLGRYVRTLMDRNTPDYPFEKMDFSYFENNDLLIANLEGPIAKQAISTTKGIAFRFMPDIAPLLKKYSFDVISLANNHTFDMGTQGYEDSLELLKEQGIIPFGNPKTIPEDSIGKISIKGKKLAFIGLEDVTSQIDTATAETEIKKLAGQGDLVIVSPHWGVEYTHSPNQRQKELARKFIDAGAFAVIGHHPHVVQAYETYNGHPVFYSLGNAVFDQYFSSATQEGLSLKISITSNQTEIQLNPIKIEKSQMRLMDEDETDEFLKRFAGWGNLSEDEQAVILSGIITIKN